MSIEQLDLLTARLGVYAVRSSGSTVLVDLRDPGDWRIMRIPGRRRVGVPDHIWADLAGTDLPDGTRDQVRVGVPHRYDMTLTSWFTQGPAQSVELLAEAELAEALDRVAEQIALDESDEDD